jgi:hypothetical protein
MRLSEGRLDRGSCLEINVVHGLSGEIGSHLEGAPLLVDGVGGVEMSKVVPDVPDLAPPPPPVPFELGPLPSRTSGSLTRCSIMRAG